MQPPYDLTTLASATPTNSNLSRHLEVTATSSFDEVPLGYRTEPATVLFLFKVLPSVRLTP